MKIASVLLLLTLPLLDFAQDGTFHSDLQTDEKPWTSLDFANDPQDFQFAIITDRTGSPREGIFEDAVKKLNWMMPEFVMSVGDLIRGASGKDSVALEEQWNNHFERIRPLKMPFFHLAGNHDIKADNQFQVDYWNRLFGTPFYSFRYKDVLFLAIFSNEAFQTISKEQISYFRDVINQNDDVRWTMIFLHHPLWRYPHDSHFDQIEALLSDRDYTVFAGHQHQYHHSIQNNSNYYVLATTGGGSPLLGNSFGSFDHITWVTMTDNGPIMANLRLDGILPHDVANEETHSLTRKLIQSLQIETNVFVDSKKAFRQGKALVTYQNSSDHSLYLDSRFYHNHHVVAEPSRLSIEIPPQSKKTVEIELQSIKPFGLSENAMLEYQGTLGYKLEEYPDLKLTGSVVLPIRNSDYDLLPTKEVDFVGSYTVRMKPALAGTQIHYTTNGKDPSTKSPTYQGPFQIQKSTIVKARIAAGDGLVMSEISELKATLVEAGEGIQAEVYPYKLTSSWGRLPDFEDQLPLQIKVTQEMDPVKVAGRDDQFGLVYKANIDLPESGKYQFKALSDDAIRVLINGNEVISDVVKHKARESFGEVILEEGSHALEIQYFQWRKAYALEVSFTTPSGKQQIITSDMLSYDQNTLDDEMHSK